MGRVTEESVCCVDADVNKQRQSAQVCASSDAVGGDASVGQREGRSYHGRWPLSVDRGGGKSGNSSQRPLQSAGTK